MSEIKNVIWNTVLEAVRTLQSKSKEVVLYEDARLVFENNFDFYYNEISTKFMSSDLPKNSLDRHKVAAVIICSIIKAKVVGIGQQYIDNYKDKEFLGNEKIAFEVALSYMHSELQRSHLEGTVPYERVFDKYVFPSPYSCNRKYGEVICRDLHFSNQNYDLSPLLLANLMFFIEDYSFCTNGIKRSR